MNLIWVFLVCCFSIGSTVTTYNFKSRRSFVAVPEYQTNEGKLLDVIYPFCFGSVATKVRLLKRYRPEWWDPGFKIKVQDTFIWGFQVLIQKTGSFKKPKHPPNLTFFYRAFFDSSNYLSNYCSNGGHCSNSKIGKSCFCVGNFYGPRCEKRKVHCVPNPCYRSKCIELEDDYRCQCEALYSGRNCTYSLLYRNFNVRNLENKNSSAENIAYRSCYDSAAKTLDVRPVGTNGQNFTVQLLSNNNRGFSILIEKKQPPNTIDHLEIFTVGSYVDRRFITNSNQCLNQGSCQNTYERQICTCPEVFTGERCEIDRRDCSSLPCENNGACQQLLDNSHRCLCPEGYGGFNCNFYAKSGVQQLPAKLLYKLQGKTRKKWVTFDTCFRDIQPRLDVQVLDRHNNSDTITAVTSYTNNHGFTVTLKPNGGAPSQNRGTFVQLKWTAAFAYEDYIVNPCLNGGRCKNTRSQHQCICMEGFTGEFCETDLNNCQNPCLNGGRCEETSEGFTCICTEGFQGSSCEMKTIERLADDLGVELVTGRTKFGAHPYECSNTKDIDVVFDLCYISRARNVTSFAVGAPQWPDTFSVEVLAITDWGFQARVVRTDTFYGGWTQEEVDLYWKALFDPTTLQTNVCQNGGFCHNTVGGQRCECRDGFSGQLCEIGP